VNRVMLYIEDDDNNISLVEALLKRRPQVELQVAMNGRDGVQAAINKQPRLILLDNRLPDATGSEILAELASLPATAAIPVVVLSSDSDDVIAQLVAEGAAEAVPKPFDIHQFMAMIDRYLPLPPKVSGDELGFRKCQATSSDSPVKASQRAA
jgi:CheY-like chemotaxis protein